MSLAATFASLDGVAPDIQARVLANVKRHFGLSGFSGLTEAQLKSIEKEMVHYLWLEGLIGASSNGQKQEHVFTSAGFALCRACGQRTLSYQNGCYQCMSPDCSFSKCDP